MKIIKDSGVLHWIYKQIVVCEQCSTEYKATQRTDFTETANIDRVWMACPRCGWKQRVFKKWNQITPKEANTVRW